MIVEYFIVCIAVLFGFVCGWIARGLEEKHSQSVGGKEKWAFKD